MAGLVDRDRADRAIFDVGVELAAGCQHLVELARGAPAVSNQRLVDLLEPLLAREIVGALVASAAHAGFAPSPPAPALIGQRVVREAGDRAGVARSRPSMIAASSSMWPS